jgi:hypothetical protein
MIANEMNRASKLLAPEDRERLRGSYERTLALANLTIQVTESRALLQFHPEAWKQLPYVTVPRRSDLPQPVRGAWRLTRRET